MRICLACDARFPGPGWACPACGETPTANGYVSFRPSVAADDAVFTQETFERLAEHEATSFWFRARNDLIAWAVRRYYPDAQSFLEVGCGTGYVLAGLRQRSPGLRLAGGDPFAAGLEIARRRLPDVDLFQLDGRRLPWEDEFDVVGAFDMLEHVEEDQQVLAELIRVVKPGGGALISVPQHPRLWASVDEFSGHKRRYTADELVGKIEAAGFGIVRKTSFVSLLLPLVMLSRLRRRDNGNAYDPRTEYRLPQSIDAFFERVMGLERFLIRRGVSLPAGTSLLVVARRP